MDTPALEHGHSVEEIRRRLATGPRSSYVRDWIYGGIDGAVTTFAVVAGVAGAELPVQTVLILGAANLIADGFSMAASNFSGTKAERDDYDRLAAVERKHVALAPDGEREEIRQIFAAKGFSDAGLERVVATITSSEPGWIQTMLAEEYGLASARRSPWAAAATTFLAFLVCGLVPLLPYVLDGGLAASTAATAVTFFSIGSAKSRWSTTVWWRSGLETFSIGMCAAALAFIVGFGLKSVVGLAA